MPSSPLRHNIISRQIRMYPHKSTPFSPSLTYPPSQGRLPHHAPWPAPLTPPYRNAEIGGRVTRYAKEVCLFSFVYCRNASIFQGHPY